MKKLDKSSLASFFLKNKFILACSIFGVILFTLSKSITMFLLMMNLFGLIPNQIDSGINILVVGTDNVQGTKRSDVISIIHINKDETSIRALSIPRDTRVNINGVGVSKINHAYAFGGITLLKQTLVEFLSIPIHHYAVIDIHGVKQFIDSIGGVDIHIDQPMVYDDYAGNLHINFPAGKNHLSGEDLIKYIRFRNDSKGDIGRIKRQQDVIQKLFKKVFSVNSILNSPRLFKLFLSSFKTDISISKATYWVDQFVKPNLDLNFYTVPGSVRIIDGVSYWRPNIVNLDHLITQTFSDYSLDKRTADESSKKYVTKNQIKRVKQQIILDKQQAIHSKGQTTIEILNGNGRVGIASKTARFLEKGNLVIKNIDNSESFDYQNTIIVDWKGNLEKSLKLAKLLEIDPSNIVVYDREEKPLDITLVLGKNWTESVVSRLKQND